VYICRLVLSGIMLHIRQERKTGHFEVAICLADHYNDATLSSENRHCHVFEMTESTELLSEPLDRRHDRCWDPHSRRFSLALLSTCRQLYRET